MHYVNLPSWAVDRGRTMRPTIVPDPQRTALLIVDMQNFFIDPAYPLSVPYGEAIIDKVAALAEGFRESGGTVVFIQQSFAVPGKPAASASADAPVVRASLVNILVPGNPAFEIHPRLTVAEGDMRVVKNTASALHPCSNSGLLEQLRAAGIDTVVVAGLVTNGCCETTARDAHQHGFKVIFAQDATATLTDEEHNAALLNLAIWFAEVLPATTILEKLDAAVEFRVSGTRSRLR